ncbi:serine hydrolase domain-containing protein [Pedobacter sp. ASV28]|uniref:serine hydrolase domain-containing protein n=1 Tax=Pedobacter sp. ASV28 TaxID=2795123 RepID=UPI00351C982B
MLKHTLIVAVSLAACATILLSCSSAREARQAKALGMLSGARDPLYLEIGKLGADLTRKESVPGIAVAVIRDGKIAFIQCIGYADLASKRPITKETIFNVGSVSKMVSAWGFVQLSEKGLVGLDSPVNRYLNRWKIPSSPFDIEKVTLRRILSHTAGLSVHGYGGAEQGTKLLSLQESLEGKTKRNGESVRLVNEPGTKWQYSGGGYTLAQLLLEERTKKTFAAYMRRHVFRPLGMNHTNYEWTEHMMANSATAYDTVGAPIKNRIFTEQAAAGLQTTIMDLAHFAELSITKNSSQLNKVLRPETVQLMEQPVMPSSIEGESGLGYRFMNYDGIRTIGHTGENVGWSAAVFMDMQIKSGIVVLCNGSNGDRVWYPIYQKWLASMSRNK